MKNYFPDNLKFLIAQKMDKDYSTIGKWELGQRNPIMSDIIKLSDIFNVSVQNLVEKDLRIKNENFDELELLFDKHKDVLTESDKTLIRTIIEQRKKEIDKELDGEWWELKIFLNQYIILLIIT